MCFFGTLTATKVAVGSSMALIGFFTFYCIVKFGSGRNLFRIWLGRLYRGMKRLCFTGNLGEGEKFPYFIGGAYIKKKLGDQNQSVPATLPK